MYVIETLDLSSWPDAQAYASDGQAVVGVARGGAGSALRLMIGGLGYIDIVDCGEQPGGPTPFAVQVGGTFFWYDPAATLSLWIDPQGACQVSGDNNAFTAPLAGFPALDNGDLGVLYQMIEMGLVPYSELPGDGRPYSDVAQTAANMFAWSANAMDLGLALYDWTTADFFRMDVFNLYRYTAAPGEPLDGDDIVAGIWTSNWPPYQPSNAAFMASLMMTPASSQAEVAAQYANVSQDLRAMLDALKGLTATALAAMPRTSTLTTPMLYSGQVDVANLGEGAFATYFLEYPGNAGPVGAPMGMPLAEALQGFLGAGQTVTLKSFISTTDSLADAAHYANGILLEIAPPAGAMLWNDCAYVTPLSDEATKTEYLFGPGSAFVMGPARQETIGGKSVTVLPMTCVA